MAKIDPTVWDTIKAITALPPGPPRPAEPVRHDPRLAGYRPPIVVPDATGQRPQVGRVDVVPSCWCAIPVGKVGTRCGRCGERIHGGRR